MLRKILMLAALLTAPIAVAQTLPSCPPGAALPTNSALICWTNATQNTDGSAIPATGDGSLLKTRVQRSFTTSTTAACGWDTTANSVQNFDVTPDVTRMYFENLPVGKYCYRLKHMAQNVPDSAWTGTVTKNSVKPVLPSTKPPTTSIY